MYLSFMWCVVYHSKAVSKISRQFQLKSFHDVSRKINFDDDFPNLNILVSLTQNFDLCGFWDYQKYHEFK